MASADRPEGGLQQKEFEGVLYSRCGPIKVTVLSRKCLKGTCTLLANKEIAEEGVFFYTTATAAGDEVGWDFVSRVLTSKISFTGYCKEMTRFYRTNNIHSAEFMSPNTFISWFFSWMSAFKIDFRKEVDPWCLYNPKMLACDGTHIGVSVRYQKIANPVTKVDLPGESVTPMHKR